MRTSYPPTISYPARGDDSESRPGLDYARVLESLARDSKRTFRAIRRYHAAQTPKYTVSGLFRATMKQWAWLLGQW